MGIAGAKALEVGGRVEWPWNWRRPARPDTQRDVRVARTCEPRGGSLPWEAGRLLQGSRWAGVGSGQDGHGGGGLGSF